MHRKFELEITEEPDGGLTVSMLVDGVPFGTDVIDLSELRQSAIASGAYDLQTCECGVPQCAGFWDPIFVQHDHDTIRWEYDGRLHPKANSEEFVDEGEPVVVWIDFDRAQYIREVQQKLNILRNHPARSRLGPYGFKADILDEPFPDVSLPQYLFERGSKIIVGYLEKYHQPWVWLEGHPEIYPRLLLPAGLLWAQFINWSLMWGSKLFYFGPCDWRKDDESFRLDGSISVVECNEAVKDLARQIQHFWGDVISVEWQKISK